MVRGGRGRDLGRARRGRRGSRVRTGVRPAAAQTLVELRIDMRGIKTLSSLEQGVSHAIARSSGREPRPKRAR
jgi:hypothetical protein